MTIVLIVRALQAAGRVYEVLFPPVLYLPAEEVFRNLMEANYQRDEEKLDDALRVLAIERETWRQMCEQLGSEKPCDEQDASGFSLQA